MPPGKVNESVTSGHAYPDVRRVQSALLRMLKNVDAICKRHRIRYWLDGGTLLGAVRHKGFIPWDDDLDIVMPRSDYETFVQVAQAELRDDLFLQTQDTDPGYAIYQVPCKIREKTSVELERQSAVVGVEWGIYLDIIPIDKYRASGLGFRIDWLLKYTYRCFCLCFIAQTKDASDSTSRLNRFLSLCKGVLPCRWFLDAYRQKLRKLAVSREAIVDACRLGYSYDSLWMRFFESGDIYPLQGMVFEDGIFPAPANCDSVLKVFYGEDYMTLPEESRRVPRNLRLADDVAQSGMAGGKRES